MNILVYGVIGGTLIVLVTFFGLYFILKLLICLIILTLGILICIYNKYTPTLDQNIKSSRYNLHKKTELLRNKIINLSRKNTNLTTDKRVTGSHIIDESLQEILDFIIRDFIEPWYNLLTNDDEFISTIRDSAQLIAINIANRVKNADWIPYLTTRIVDDVASHMRLYRQARAKMLHLQKSSKKNTKNSKNNNNNNNNNNNSSTTSTCSSSNSSGTTPKRSPTHRRNKSETDISWYSQSKFYIPNLTSLNEPLLKQQEKNNKLNESVETTLEDLFFNLEIKMENNLLCRDQVCTNKNNELEFLSELSEILLYLLLPKNDFNCMSIRIILRELLVNIVIQPMLDLLSDPDYINQTCIWLCLKDTKLLPIDIFLTIIRITDSIDELISTKNLINNEMIYLRSRDSGGEDDLIVKQQLNSLNYVKKLLDTRIISMQEGLFDDKDIDLTRIITTTTTTTSNDKNKINNVPVYKLINLPLDELLKNNIALSYFIDFITRINSEDYLYFYLNIYGWKVSAEQQLSDIELQKIINHSNNKNNIPTSSIKKSCNLDNLKEAALKIYQQYLSDKAVSKLQFDEEIVKKLLIRIKTETVKDTWFDELQSSCYDKLQNDDKFLPSFKRSKLYIKLLAELDLLKDNNSEDGISISSINNDLDENQENPSTSSIKSASNSSTSLTSIEKENELFPDSSGIKIEKNTNKNYLETSDEISEAKEATFYLESTSQQFIKIDETLCDKNAIKKLQQGKFTLKTEIIETGIVNDRGKTYGIYAISVTRNYDSGYNEKWHIYRRYSDFHDLHQKIKEKYYDLAKLIFPAKKTFHNMDRSVLEKRMIMLNAWLNKLTMPSITDGHMGLQNMLLGFLEQGDYDKGVTGGQISRTIDTLVNPLKTSMKTVTQAVKTMPDNMLSTVDGVMDNISKFFGNPRKNSGFFESAKVGASIDTETDDNIPLRIILLLMDEVFDLKVRNQWLRRRIVTLLRQIIRTMFGDIVNRRIVEYVSFLTSPTNVATYLQLFKQSFWPNGVRADAKPPRDSETKNRTRVAAKVALLSCLSDELKHIIGSETTRRGLLLVFELFQRPILNRRLVYVLFEGIIENLFPDNDLITIIRKLYSKSPRVKEKKSNSNS